MARDNTRHSLSISGECYRALKVYAKKAGKPHSQIVEALIRDYINVPSRRVVTNGRVRWEHW